MKRTRESPPRAEHLGAKASRRVQRWPSHNHFTDLELKGPSVHPIDQLIDGCPEVSRPSRRARRLLERIQHRAGNGAILDFEAERNAAEWARVETAYNLGFEGGLVLGRADGVRYAVHGGRRGKDELALLRGIRSALAASTLPPGRVQMVLLELAYAHAAGPAEDEEAGPPRGE
jgi:hypothetical protein